jgi:hypothetical protein
MEEGKPMTVSDDQVELDRETAVRMLEGEPYLKDSHFVAKVMLGLIGAFDRKAAALREADRNDIEMRLLVARAESSRDAMRGLLVEWNEEGSPCLNGDGCECLAARTDRALSAQGGTPPAPGGSAPPADAPGRVASLCLCGRWKGHAEPCGAPEDALPTPPAEPGEGFEAWHERGTKKQQERHGVAGNCPAAPGFTPCDGVTRWPSSGSWIAGREKYAGRTCREVYEAERPRAAWMEEVLREMADEIRVSKLEEAVVSAAEAWANGPSGEPVAEAALFKAVRELREGKSSERAGGRG